MDISGLSDGESLRFIPGIVAALAFNSESKWIPLPLDRFEAISENERDQFIEGVSSLIEKGCLSQAFFAGCPDKAVESDTVSLWKTTSSDSAPEPGF